MAIINSVIVGGGSAPEPYPLLSRVKDDNNNEIGTVCGYHTDANNQKYAVVCLDAQYRGIGGQYFSSNITDVVPGLPTYTWSTNGADVYISSDTATSNCDAIIASGFSSPAVSHCRALSFVIGGVTYYGQTPTVKEIVYVFLNRTTINSMDTSLSQYPTAEFLCGQAWVTSMQVNNKWCWGFTANGQVGDLQKNNSSCNVAPVLEIPIQ